MRNVVRLCGTRFFCSRGGSRLSNFC